jgi:ribonuclease HI
MERLAHLLLLLASGKNLQDSWKKAGYASMRAARMEIRKLADSLGGSAGAGGVQSLVVYVDGAAKGNPGPAAVAAVACLPDGEVLTTSARGIGRATNNVAEYRALLEGIRLARDLGAREVVFRLDSELVVKQMNGEYKIKNKALKLLAAEAESEAACFERITYEKIPRESNREADRLANEALD